MRGILLTIALFIFITGGYLYWQQSDFTESDKRSVTEDLRAADRGPVNTEIDSSERQALLEEARQYVAEITEHDDDPVEVERADDFVTRDEPISLFPSREYETHTLNELKASIHPDAPLTIVREQEQVEMTTAGELLAVSGGNLQTPVKVLEGDAVKTSTVGKIVKDRAGPESTVSIIRKTESLEVTTLRELMNNETLATNEPLKIIREPYRLQTTTVAELLMGEKAATNNSIFYVRNVTEEDVQGLWGIVHNGLIMNFASGIALRRGREIRNYQVDIPSSADERLADQSSSFLGKMIDQKTRESYVYNYKQGIMGRNPDLLQPGQEVVIIGFTPEELYKIYAHFVTRSESRS